MMARVIHELKISPNFFNDILLKGKNFEIRFNDRDFKCGDVVILKEFEGDKYLSGIIQCEIAYILENYTGLERDYVILGLKNIIPIKKDKK